ncbi:MAG: hypothetical protein H0U26_05900 [Acidimicrobiia bacterium]|nr:hypothetical protein [Acidimicrobiia bacterium]
MRTLVRLVVVTATVFALSASADAAERFRFQGSSKGADAFFTDCPDRPRNVTCSFSDIFASRFKGKDNGTHYAGAGVFVDKLTVRFDGNSRGTVIAAKFGFAETEVSVRGRLAKASVDTVVPLCDSEGGGCVNTRVKADWRATSGRETFKERFIDTFGGTRIEFKGTFTSRDASVNASVGGTNLGPADFATITSSRFTQVIECEDTCDGFGPELEGVGDTTTASPREIILSHAR